ncbi:MAG TPA: hydroxymethylglutaryl-CoA lyase [Burkholderiales bacterium]|jgi:hydroxymethylglutaryl-CoA lyase|nr:hydroxymethylglutaryl-CoA lyase [Burkholderiales bacterium]
MSDLPKSVHIFEQGPREGFQFEKGPIPTARKIELVDALSNTGLKQIQVCSFVPAKNVPGMADADEVAAGFKRRPGVRYEALSLNEKGLERAIASGRFDTTGIISLTASEAFLKRNQKRTLQENYEAQHGMIEMYQRHNVPVDRGSIMAVFGCNFEGDISIERVLNTVDQIFELAAEHGVTLKVLNLSDTMAWATPTGLKRVVGAVRDKYPDQRLSLHLHDTRGMAVALAYAGLEMGVDIYDACVAGLGGCPFAAHKGAAGNICTEDLVFMCEEMGIDTGVDLELMLDAARLAEDIVGHPLPGCVMKGGTLGSLREKVRAAA